MLCERTFFFKTVLYTFHKAEYIHELIFVHLHPYLIFVWINTHWYTYSACMCMTVYVRSCVSICTCLCLHSCACVYASCIHTHLTVYMCPLDYTLTIIFFARRATSFVLFPWVDISILRLLVAVSQFVFCCERIFPYWCFKEHLRVGKY